MLLESPCNVEKFSNSDNLQNIENFQDVEKLQNFENAKDIENAEGVEEVVEVENFEYVEVEDIEDIEAIVRLLRLFRVHTVVHSGDQGGPCKASFAKYISHQTKAQKLKFDLKDLPYEVSDTKLVAVTKLTERPEDASNI